MIRGQQLNISPFAQYRCPELDEKNDCTRPYCPYQHGGTDETRGIEGHVALVLERHQSKWQTANAIREQQYQEADTMISTRTMMGGNIRLLSTTQSTPFIQQENLSSNDGYSGTSSYVGYMSNDDINQCATMSFNSPIVSKQSSMCNFPLHHQPIYQQTSNLSQTLLLPNTSEEITQQTPNFHPPANKPPQVGTKKSVIPIYTPTPIAQLEREKEERKKRKELAERQKRIRERLMNTQQQQIETNHNGKRKTETTCKKMKTFTVQQQGNKVTDGSFPIDQIMAEQEELLMDKELSKVELDKRQQRKQLKETVEASKQRKGMSESLISTVKPANPSNKIPDDSSSPEWLTKNTSLKMMNQFDEHLAAWKEKTQVGSEKSSNKLLIAEEESNGDDDDKEEADTAVEIIKASNKKSDKDEAKSIVTTEQKNAKNKIHAINLKIIEKPKTVIDELIEKAENKKKKQEKEKRASSEKHIPKINTIIKNVTQLDRNIEDLEKEIRHSTNKLAKLQSTSSASLSLAASRQKQMEKKKLPVWRHPEKTKTSLTNVLEENALNIANQQSSKTIINTLFGNDDDLKVVFERKTDKKKKKSILPIWDINEKNPGKKRRASSSTSSGNEKQGERKKVKMHEDQATRLECQALVDLLSSSESDTEEKKNNNGGDKICSDIVKKRPVQLASTSTTNPIKYTSSSIIPPTTISPISSPKQTIFVQSTISETQVRSTTTKSDNISTDKHRRSKMPSAQEQLHNRTLKTILEITGNEKEIQICNQAEMKESSNLPENAHKLKSVMVSEKPQIIKEKITASSSFPTNYKAKAKSLTARNPSTTATIKMLPVKQSINKPQLIQQTLPSRLKKGEQRKAHVPKLSIGTSSIRQLVPLEPTNRKVSLQLRQSRLNLIHAECAKIFADDPDAAIERAQLEEKAILDRCTTRNGYNSAVPNAIKRLRDFMVTENGTGERKNSVSHHNVLLGRHANSVTLGLHRSHGQHKEATNCEFDFYNALIRNYVLTAEQLWDNGYPRWIDKTDEEKQDEDMDMDNPDPGETQSKRHVEIRQSELDTNKSRSQKQFINDCELKRICARCGSEYRLTKDANYAPGTSSDECIYHWGKAWKKRVQGSVDTRYTCCQSSLEVRGCVVAGRHITQTLRMSTLEEYVDTPPPLGMCDSRSMKVYAMDCEMVYSVWGPEVARVSLVDVLGELVLDLLIRPEHRLIDCNTKFSGLNADQVLNAKCNLQQARQRLFEFVNSETILIGHSLESDLRALRIVHTRVVDTSIVYPHRLGPPQKRALKTLAAEILQLIIQEDENGHDSKEDALTCMRIMLKKSRSDSGNEKH